MKSYGIAMVAGTLAMDGNASSNLSGSFTGSFSGSTTDEFYASGAFSGSYEGDGALLTGIVATDLDIDAFGDDLTGTTITGADRLIVSDASEGGSEGRMNISQLAPALVGAGLDASQGSLRINATAAGNGLSGGDGSALAVNVDDSSIEIDTDSLRVKASGITNAMLNGSIANDKLANDGITIAGVDTSLGGTITADTIAGQISADTITNSQLANDNITIAGASTALGGTITADTIAGAISNDTITNAQLANDSITINGTSTALGTSYSVTKADVGLGNADNTSDASKPVSTATQTALDLKAPLASPTFTGTVSGVTKAHVGLGNVDNTADSAKPVSTAQQTALNLKANLASPTFTGTVIAPTPSNGDDSTKVATTAFVMQEVSDLLGGAPAAYDTLIELSASLANGDSDVVALTAEVATKATKANNLSDLTNASTARTNLGLGSIATLSSIDISTNTNLAASTGITLTGDTLTTNDGQIVHDNLSGFVADEHIAHSGVTLTAGNGLTGGGTIAASRTFAVGAGTLIDVAADTVNVDLSELSTSTTNGDGDYFVVVDTSNAQRKLTKANIALSEFNNDSGWTSNVGDITGVTAGNGLTGGGSSGAVTVNVVAGTGISVAADSVSTNDGQIVHDNLSGFVANEHIDHSGVSITAGNGLTGGGTINSTRTLNIGEGTGITVAADTISTNDGEIVHDNLSGFVANEHIDHSGVSITAGNGLTGGGTINSTRTLNIGEGTGITVAADTISTNDGEIVHDNLSGFVANEHIDHSGVSILAGNGLTGGGTINSTRTLNIGAGTGIDVAADAISVDVSDFMSNGANNRILTATGTDAMNAEANLTFDGTTFLVSAAKSRTDGLGVGIAPSSTVGVIQASNDVIAFASSDERLKENVTSIESALNKVESLRGVEFDWIANKEIHPNEGHDLGVIAQEVEAVLPELVQTRENGYKAVKYDKLTAVLIEAVKELSARVKTLEGYHN